MTTSRGIGVADASTRRNLNPLPGGSTSGSPGTARISRSGATSIDTPYAVDAAEVFTRRRICPRPDSTRHPMRSSARSSVIAIEACASADRSADAFDASALRPDFTANTAAITADATAATAATHVATSPQSMPRTLPMRGHRDHD